MSALAPCQHLSQRNSAAECNMLIGETILKSLTSCQSSDHPTIASLGSATFHSQKGAMALSAGDSRRYSQGFLFHVGWALVQKSELHLASCETRPGY